MSALENPFLKKSDEKTKNQTKTENQCQNAARENKKTTSEICNFDTNKKTYPADCRKIAAVDSKKHDWD